MVYSRVIGLVGAGFVFAFAMASFAPKADATPVTYTLTSGSLDTVQLLDLSDPTAGDCPIGGGNCLAAPMPLTTATVVIDTDTNELLNLTITIAGTGQLDLGGVNGWETALFTGTEFQSSGTTGLTDVGGGQFNLDPVTGDVTIDNVDLFAVGNVGTTPDFSGTFGPQGTAPTGSFIVTGDEVALTLFGLNIGIFADPMTGGDLVAAKADFHFTAAVPEPSAPLLFVVALLVAGAGTGMGRANKFGLSR